MVVPRTHAERIIDESIRLVKKLDEKRPARSYNLWMLTHRQYSRLAEGKDPLDMDIPKNTKSADMAEVKQNVAANVMQHRTLLRFLVPKIAGYVKAKPRERKELVKVIINAHGEIPPLNPQEYKKEGKLPLPAIRRFKYYSAP